ncbi:MAG: class I SAM-dependent methyltransferase [Bacteroidales bacterium]|jgi:hypothetical protein|nr:class I SAM-dependent methyltransferase [Bacteroidales bacterium]
MKEFWDNRYSSDEYVYGKEPNSFYKEYLDKINYSANILFPAEGEGRNAVYAAKMGHSVLAFDISSSGKDKALRLAKDSGVTIEYLVGDLKSLNLKPESFDIAVLTSAHFPPNLRQGLHRDIAALIKPDGIIILEGFSVNNLQIRRDNPEVGGPDREDMLFTKQMIADDFSEFEIITLEEVDTILNEGDLHNGKGKVIRFVGRKLGNNKTV